MFLIGGGKRESFQAGRLGFELGRIAAKERDPSGDPSCMDRL